MAAFFKMMKDWLSELEEVVDKERYKRKIAKENKEVALQLDIYKGYATKKFIFCKGRVLVDKQLRVTIYDSTWQNFVNSYHRFDSDEVAGAEVHINYQGQHFTVITDSEGYFTLRQRIPALSSPINPGIWQPIYLELKKSPIKASNLPLKVQAQVLLPNQHAHCGIISDIDDTIIQTHVKSKTKMLYYSLFKNAYTRLAFKGVAALYWSFRKGPTDQQQNPIFYVSNGFWNLYDMLTEFIDINHLPPAPMLLRDFGLSNSPEQADAFKNHKQNEIFNILATYPTLPFVLVGDSGERDADIYIAAAKQFPTQIKAIYIRSVKDEKSDARVQQIAENNKTLVPIYLFSDSLAAAKHAQNMELISQKGVHKVQQSMYHYHSSVADTWFEEE